MSRDWRRDARLLTSPFRVLPDFVIPGEAKCGTTSLYRYLTKHPDIYAAAVKEPRNFMEYPGSAFFCRAHYPTRLARWYRTAVRGRRFVTGEATAEYLSRAKVTASLKAVVPDVKIIVLLRNPVTRAYSDYQMFRSRGMVEPEFAEVVARSIAWLSDPALDDLVAAAAEREHFYLRFVARGLYVRNLRRWLACFPREQILIVRSEDFFAEPQRVLDQAFEFLGVEPRPVETGEIKRKGEYSGGMDDESRARLAGFYAPHNQALYELIGRDLGWEEARDGVPGQ